MRASNKQYVEQQQCFLITLPAPWDVYKTLWRLMRTSAGIVDEKTNSFWHVWAKFADFWAFIDWSGDFGCLCRSRRSWLYLGGGRRDEEKLRERFSSSHGSRNSKEFVFIEKKQNQLSQRLFTLLGLQVASNDHSKAEQLLQHFWELFVESIGCRFSTDIDYSRFKGQSMEKSVNNWKQADILGEQVTFVTSTGCLSCIVCARERDIKILSPRMVLMHRHIPLPKRVSSSCRMRFDDFKRSDTRWFTRKDMKNYCRPNFYPFNKLRIPTDGARRRQKLKASRRY